ncbi:Gfo/Idh/MocA family protein [Nocardia wallacei]|uniref:Gfo/Idh/MocA family protein n=1 Tax=Nocardia wallacei TaxID=480035 RepID=UPI0024576D05|nr:Gfo/Idh/MocA family oxidoreductase [Nocardia wallacei]
MTIRLGVLGCADVARRKTLPALEQVPDLSLVALASRELDKAETFSARFGGEPVAGYDALLARTDIDAVYIPLPPSLHAHWARRALHAGLHVLVEKPLATTKAEACAAASAAVEQDLVLAENFAFLHHSLHATVTQLVTDGVIGELRALTADFGFPPLPDGDIRYRPELRGGALYDAGVYPIRAAQLFLGPQLELLGAMLRMSPKHGVDIGGSALLASPTGVTAQLTFGFAHDYRCAYTLWGERGRISVHRAFTPPDDLAPIVRIGRQGVVEERRLRPDTQFRNSLVAFARAVATGRGTDVAALVRQAELVEAIATTARRVH